MFFVSIEVKMSLLAPSSREMVTFNSKHMLSWFVLEGGGYPSAEYQFWIMKYSTYKSGRDNWLWRLHHDNHAGQHFGVLAKAGECSLNVVITYAYGSKYWK